MVLKCAPACMSCDQLSYDLRCESFLRRQANHSSNDIWQTGDLNRFFERITAPNNASYLQPSQAITILSQPRPENGHALPWVITIDHFLTDEECDRFIQFGEEKGFEPSTWSGAVQLDGSIENIASEARTSSNTWCDASCATDPVVQNVSRRIETLTGVPQVNTELFQLLKYTHGQYYHPHNDFNPPHVTRPPGPRILTVFLYLNTVPAGGGTRFVHLNQTVAAVRGRAVIWSSVQNQNLNAMDVWTDHEALPVTAGVKYAANAWVRVSWLLV